jgi:hypothetical protein
MKSILLAVVLMAALPAFAKTQPASEESIRELMTLTNSRSVLDNAYGQLDGIMEQAMKQAVGDRPVTPEQERLMAEMRARMVELFRNEMGWDKLEPSYIKMYRETFTQEEVNGMRKFYKSRAGKAVIGKLPQMIQSLMQILLTEMQVVTPKVRALQEEYTAKLVEAGKQPVESAKGPQAN